MYKIECSQCQSEVKTFQKTIVQMPIWSIRRCYSQTQKFITDKNLLTLLLTPATPNNPAAQAEP